MHSNIWGPYCWHIMHVLTYNYPENPSEQDKNIIKDFFTSLRYIIPCTVCRMHYNKKITKSPITQVYSNKQKLIKWCIDMHNEVNRVFNKKIYTVEDANKIYLKNNKLIFDHYKLSLIMDIIVETCPDNIDIEKITTGYVQFFSSLSYLYPCIVCKYSFYKNLINNPLNKNINNSSTLKIWYNKTKSWQNIHKYNEQIYVFKYRLFNNKTKKKDKLMFNTNTQYIKKLNKTENILINKSNYRIIQHVILMDDSIKSFILADNIPNFVILTDIKLLTFIDYNIKNIKNSVPVELRT